MTVDAALRELASGTGPAALATVARVSGSAPRHAGSRMALRADGRLAGSVGGGRPEALALEAARACIASGRNATLAVEMTGAEAKGADLICGGNAELWIEFVADRGLYRAAVAAVDAGEHAVLAQSSGSGCVAVLGGDGRLLGGSRAGLDEAALASSLRGGQPRFGADGLLYSPIEPADRLLILGGGHVGLALARVASALSFQTTVVDPRPEFSDPARFPAEVACLRQPFVEAIEGFRFGPSSYVVIVSPGHVGDLDCARAVLGKEYRYAGLIGSRRKSRMLIEELIAEGADRSAAEALRSPIGLDIASETPEEIAISIAAEMIAVRHDASILGTMDAERRRLRLG